jgi:hypothetical protein
VFILPFLTYPYYGVGELWTDCDDDRKDRSATRAKSDHSRSLPRSSLEASFHSHMYEESTVSGTGMNCSMLRSHQMRSIFQPMSQIMK